MCKPGSACCGSGVTSGGFGIALAVLGTVGAVSMASVVVSAILTALLVTVFSVAAGGAIMVVIVLRRTRGVVTWPMGISRLPAAGARHARTGPAWPRLHSHLIVRPCGLTARASSDARNRQRRMRGRDGDPGGRAHNAGRAAC